MADPITVGLIVGSSLLSAKGALDEGKAEAAAREFNAKVSERNAVISEQEAFNIGIEGDLTVQRLKKEFESMRSEQRVALMGSGFDITSGSPLQIQMETAAEQDLDISITEYNNKVAQAASMESAVQERLQASLERFYGSQAKKAARTKAASSLLSGAKSVRKEYG